MKLPSPFTKKQAQRNADSLSAAGVSLCLLFSLRNGEFCGKMTIIYLKVFLDTGRPHGVILLIHVLLDIGNRFITASSFFKMEERKFENGLILLFQTKLQRTIKGLQYTPYIIMGDVSTDQFRLLPNDDQMNAIAFLLIMERVEDGSGLGNYIAEDAVIRMLNQLENQKSIDE